MNPAIKISAIKTKANVGRSRKTFVRPMLVHGDFLTVGKTKLAIRDDRCSGRKTDDDGGGLRRCPDLTDRRRVDRAVGSTTITDECESSRKAVTGT